MLFELPLDLSMFPDELVEVTKNPTVDFNRQHSLRLGAAPILQNFLCCIQSTSNFNHTELKAFYRRYPKKVVFVFSQKVFELAQKYAQGLRLDAACVLLAYLYCVSQASPGVGIQLTPNW